MASVTVLQNLLPKNELVVKSGWRSNHSSTSNVHPRALKKCGRLFYTSFWGMTGRERIQKTDLTLMRYCGHLLIKAEDGAKNYKHDHRLPLAWRPFTVSFVRRKGYSFQSPLSEFLFPHDCGRAHLTLTDCSYISEDNLFQWSLGITQYCYGSTLMVKTITTNKLGQWAPLY